MGRQIKAPIFGIGVPIKDKNGKVIAALAGVINLSESNFMDRIEHSYVSGSGSYLLIDATHRVIVASSEQRAPDGTACRGHSLTLSSTNSSAVSRERGVYKPSWLRSHLWRQTPE